MKLNQLLFETTTSEFLKQEQNKAQTLELKPAVQSFMLDKLQIRQDILQKFINWFTKELIRQKIDKTITIEVLGNWWDNIGDWITSRYADIHSKFNRVEFEYADAIEESEAWHEKLATNKAKPGANGRVVVSLEDVPGFNGWNWVALDKTKCKIEGDAMGHCGNAAGKEPQNILSLRDPKNVPHLTFINNKGSLGEMKGRGNSKPSKKYHPAIIKLLLSNEVGTLAGGGYMPHNNFELTDLTPEQQETVSKAKPYINKPDVFNSKRDKLLAGQATKLTNKAMHQATDENMPSVVKQIIRDMLVPDMWDEKRLTTRLQDKLSVDFHGNSKRMFDTFSYFLNLTYEKSKKVNDSNRLFEWMDRLVESFVREVVEIDLETIGKFSNPDIAQYYRNISLIVLLDQLVYRLYEQQPDIMRTMPKRNRFKTFDDYVMFLKQRMNKTGYELPSFRPESNMISYEFLVKCGQEIAKQGRQVVEKLNLVV